MKSEATISPDDPRLSAYLFGELSVEESLLVEAQLRRSPEARAELEEFRAMSDLLRDSFAAELAGAALDQPALSLLPAPRVEDKVVAFTGTGIESQRNWGRVAAVATLAAAVVIALVMLPKAVPMSGGAPGALASVDPVVAPQPASADGETTRRLTATKVPAFGYRGEADSANGLHEVAWTAGDPEVGFEGRPRSLGSDPTITEVRFLSDDPIDLRSAPVPAELLSYLPDGRSGQGGVSTAMFHPDSDLRGGGQSHLYLDTDRYPDPEIVHRRVELAGGVFQVEGHRTRSLYRAEQRSDAAGRTSVILKGMIRLEADIEPAAVIDEPDPSYDFGVTPVVWSPLGSSTDTEFEAEAASDDIAARYIVRQRERVRRAESLVEIAIGLLENGEADSAATQLELAVALLPEAPATSELRSRALSLLEKAGAALTE